MEILEFSKVKLSPKDGINYLKSFNINSELFKQGINEIETIFSLLSESTLSKFVVDLSLARGLDYYTGSIFEVKLDNYPEYGSLGAGGSYQNLCGNFINKQLPGMGASIGITRIISLLIDNKLVNLKNTLTKVLVAVYNEEQRKECNKIANTFSELGCNTEVFYKSSKIGKQIEYADKLGIRNVIFLDPENDNKISIKDLINKTQEDVDDIYKWWGYAKNRI